MCEILQQILSNHSISHFTGDICTISFLIGMQYNFLTCVMVRKEMFLYYCGPVRLDSFLHVVSLTFMSLSLNIPRVRLKHVVGPRVIAFQACCSVCGSIPALTCVRLVSWWTRRRGASLSHGGPLIRDLQWEWHTQTFSHMALISDTHKLGPGVMGQDVSLNNALSTVGFKDTLTSFIQKMNIDNTTKNQSTCTCCCYLTEALYIRV